jgi:hypothetical protein
MASSWSRARSRWCGAGATLHRVLSGEGLYGELPADDGLVAMRRVLSRAPVISAGINETDRQIIASAISEDPATRPGTARELAERIEG